MKRKTLHLTCAIPSCGQPARGSSGMCARCQQWWRYHRYQSAGEYARYATRVQLAVSRLNGRTRFVHTKIGRRAA